MPLCATVFLSMNAVTTSEITGGQGRVSVHIDKYAASKDGTNEVFHSAYIGGMNAPRFNAFLAQTIEAKSRP